MLVSPFPTCQRRLPNASTSRPRRSQSGPRNRRADKRCGAGWVCRGEYALRAQNHSRHDEDRFPAADAEHRGRCRPIAPRWHRIGELGRMPMPAIHGISRPIDLIASVHLGRGHVRHDLTVGAQVGTNTHVASTRSRRAMATRNGRARIRSPRTHRTLSPRRVKRRPGCLCCSSAGTAPRPAPGSRTATLAHPPRFRAGVHHLADSGESPAYRP